MAVKRTSTRPLRILLDDLRLAAARVPLPRLGDDVERNAERAVQDRLRRRAARLGLPRQGPETMEAVKPIPLDGVEHDAHRATSMLGPTVSALGLEEERGRREGRD